eukprot:365677-Chlamydomonas_euryale.AAC.3
MSSQQDIRQVQDFNAAVHPTPRKRHSAISLGLSAKHGNWGVPARARRCGLLPTTQAWQRGGLHTLSGRRPSADPWGQPPPARAAARAAAERQASAEESALTRLPVAFHRHAAQAARTAGAPAAAAAPATAYAPPASPIRAAAHEAQ